MTSDDAPTDRGPDRDPRILRLLHQHGRAAWMLVGILLATGLLGYVFTQVKLILLAVFVALVHAAIVTPIARWLESRGFGRRLAAALGLLLVVLTFGSITGAATYRLAQELPEVVQQVQDERPRIMATLRQEPLSLSEREVNALFETTLDRLGTGVGAEDGDDDSAAGDGDGGEDAEELPDDGEGVAPSTAFALVQGSAAALRVLGFISVGIVLSFFIVRDRDRITDGVVRHLAGGAHDSRARAVLRSAWRALLGYVRASVLVGTLEAVVIGTTLLIVGTPLAASLAVLTFIAAFIPVAGATVAGVLAVGLTWIGVGFTEALVVGGVVLAVQQLDGNVLQPALVATQTRLHPIATILALLVGGLVGGLLGALLAVPATAVLTAVAGELLDPSDPDPEPMTA